MIDNDFKKLRSFFKVSKEVLHEGSMGSEVVQFVGGFDPCRAQNFKLSHLSNIVAYECAANTIIKELLLNSKDVFSELQMVSNHVQSVLIDMDM